MGQETCKYLRAESVRPLVGLEAPTSNTSVDWNSLSHSPPSPAFWSLVRFPRKGFTKEEHSEVIVGLSFISNVKQDAISKFIVSENYLNPLVQNYLWA